MVMRRLIQRYLLTIENPNKPFQSHAPQLTVERLGDCGELKDMIAQLQGMLRRSEERKGLADAAKPQSEVSAYQETKISFLGAVLGITHKLGRKQVQARL